MRSALLPAGEKRHTACTTEAIFIKSFRKDLHLKAIALFAALLMSATAQAQSLPPQETIPVKARQIQNFKIGSDQKTFGKLEFIGGIEMSSSNALLGAISSIRFRPDGRSFVAVMDTGHWLEGRIERDAKGKLSGVSDLIGTSMMDTKGRSEQVKNRMDAE